MTEAANREKRDLLARSTAALTKRLRTIDVVRKELRSIGDDDPKRAAGLQAKLAGLEGQLTAACQELVIAAKRPRIVFIDVIRNDAGDAVGLRPIYEGEE